MKGNCNETLSLRGACQPCALGRSGGGALITDPSSRPLRADTVMDPSSSGPITEPVRTRFKCFVMDRARLKYDLQRDLRPMRDYLTLRGTVT